MRPKNYTGPMSLFLSSLAMPSGPMHQRKLTLPFGNELATEHSFSAGGIHGAQFRRVKAWRKRNRASRFARQKQRRIEK